MIKYYFENIREKLIQEIRKAEFDIYVAVAWFTDKELWNVLAEKAQNGLIIQVVLVQDEVNLGTGLDFDELTKLGIQIYWDNHHHKYCVIDRNTLITGSYNWTYAAKERKLRENIIILSNEPKVCKDYASEFRLLLKQSTKHCINIPVKVIEKVTVIEKEEKIIIDNNLRKASWFKTHQRRSEWWKKQDERWKYVFRILFHFENNPGKQLLQDIFLTKILDLSEHRIHNIDGIKHLTNIETLYLSQDFDSYNLRVLKEILPNTIINQKETDYYEQD